jgi:hypothetical protein
MTRETPWSGNEVLREVPGGPELIAWYGEVPSFHDGEIVAIDLLAKGRGRLVVHHWNAHTKYDERHQAARSIHNCIVTFILDEIIDTEFDGFSNQNIIYEINLRRAPESSERSRFHGLKASPEDIEIKILPTLGVGGTIRCRRVSIEFETFGLPT